MAVTNPYEHEYVSGLNAKVSITSPDPDLASLIKVPKLNIVTLEFTETQQKLPIYGYKSEEWDAVLRGEKLLQGTFSLNMSSAYQLSRHLGPAAYSSTPSSLRSLPLEKNNDSNYWFEKTLTPVPTAAHFIDGWAHRTVDGWSEARFPTEGEAREAAPTFDPIYMTDRSIKKQITKNSFSIELIYSKVSLKKVRITTKEEFDETTGLFVKQDLAQPYEEYSEVSSMMNITLSNIMINSIQQVISTDGAPIGEFYSFIGKESTRDVFRDTTYKSLNERKILDDQGIVRSKNFR